MDITEKDIVIKFEDGCGIQTVNDITKFVGLVKAKCFVSIIDNLNLEANPRSSKTGAVTDAIEETIESSPELFPFMSKGVLLASSDYKNPKESYIKIIPDDPKIEGILDGGHNTLAIGLHILRKSLECNGETLSKGTKKWDDFKKLWFEKRNVIRDYLDKEARENGKDLDFLVPVELLVPKDINDCDCLLSFKNNLFDICEARNNNAELQLSAKANQKGYFDELRQMLEKSNPKIANRIEWKTNDGGEIKAQDLIALAWIPLNMIEPVCAANDNSQMLEGVAPKTLYSGKGACMKQFEKLMTSPDVTDESGDGYKRTLLNEEVKSALKLATEIPTLYDYIYTTFPTYYNAAGGRFNAITAAKRMNDKKKNKKSPFSGEPIETITPDGFIAPLVYGLQALIVKRKENGYTVLRWSQDPMHFLKNNLREIVAGYADILSMCNYDPQKVGKSTQSYKTALDKFKMAIAGIS